MPRSETNVNVNAKTMQLHTQEQDTTESCAVAEMQLGLAQFCKAVIMLHLQNLKKN